MSSNILVLGAVALILVLVLFGFLLGFLRGFRKSLYFTIIFIVVVILSFIFATALAKSVYSGSSLWKVAKGVIPESVKEGSESVNSIKEFVRFYITHNYTEMLESGKTAGESIVANENAMGIIDGLLVMILKVVMIIGSYIVLTVLFYIVFGLIYVLFLRQKTMIETTTTTDEDGKEVVEEKEIKPNKKRLGGGLVGAAKGFIKAMIILIPISFAVGMIAQIEIPTNSSANAEVRYESNSSSTKTLEDIVNACKAYDKSIGKMQLGLDDFVMDKIISYDVKDANGKKVKVVLRKEVSGFINIYNTIEKEIGVDNLKNYDFKANINSSEMKAIVKSVTDNLSNSKATTTLLSAVGEEGSVILADKASKNDSDIKLLFDEVDLKGKDSKWWSEQIEQLNDIYVSFADMKLNLSAADTKEYNLIFNETTSQSFEHFVDEIFNNELLEMLIGGGVKYAAKKLPSDLAEVETTIDNVVEDQEVAKEVKSFSKLIDIIRDDIKFKDGTVDMDSLKIETLNKLVDTEILVNSKIVGKTTTVLLKNAINDITYNGSVISFDKTMFDDANFKIHDELHNLTTVLAEGFGVKYSLGELKDFENTTTVGQISRMLDSNNLPQSKIANGIFSGVLPLAALVIAPSEDFDDITWKDEYKPFSALLTNMFSDDELLVNMANIDFDSLTLKKIDDLAKADKAWAGKAIPRIFNGLVIPFMEDIQIDGHTVEMVYDKNNIKWRNELASIVEIGLWANDTDDDPTNDYNNSVSTIQNAFGDNLKVRVLYTLGTEVQDDKETELLHAFANGALKQLLGSNVGDAKDECIALSQVANILDDNTSDNYLAYGYIVVSTLESKATGSLPEAQFKTMTNTLTECIGDSNYLQSILSTNLATDVDKSSWDSTKWESEMSSVNNVVQEMEPDSEGNIAMNSMSDSMEEINDNMLTELETNTPESEILQDIFSTTLVSNSLITNKTDITNWDLEMEGLITVIKTMEDENNRVKISNLTTITTIKVRTVDSLKTNTAKSVVLMNTMGSNLNEPLSTPSMTSWDSYRWANEMPHIAEVLKTLANDPTDFDDAIVIDDANMGEDTEIKKITFQRLELHIAYSEALENMFKNAMKDVEDSENPYVFPNPDSITGIGDDLYSVWWDAEITGLANVIYAEMYATGSSKIKISDFSDTESAKVAVVKSLSSLAILSDEEGHPTDVEKSKTYSDPDNINPDYTQYTNIGVSEYLQYMFKPNLRDLSKNGTNYYTFYYGYNWDYEMEKIMNVFLTTQMTYDIELDDIRALNDNEEVAFEDEVNFKLRTADDCGGNAKYAAKLNIAILDSINSNIDSNSYLQYVLAPEMKRMMNGYDPEYSIYIVKDPTVVSGNDTNWTNDEWLSETSMLSELGNSLISETSPKMEGFSFYDLSDAQIDKICELTPKSYLLQAKMAKPLVEAGINSTDITTVSSLTGSMNLMEYIAKHEWNEGTNEAYGVVMTTLSTKREALRSIKNGNYDVETVSYDHFRMWFYDEAEVPNALVIIDGNDGSVTDGEGNPFLTDDVSTESKAITTYAEYTLMVEALKKCEDSLINNLAPKVAERGNEFIYSE